MLPELIHYFAILLDQEGEEVTATSSACVAFPLEEERVMQQSSASISLSFESQGINPVGGFSQVPRAYTNKQEPRNQRDKGVVNPFTATCESEI